MSKYSLHYLIKCNWYKALLFFEHAGDYPYLWIGSPFDFLSRLRTYCLDHELFATFLVIHSMPFLASSTFLAASLGLKPPLETQMRWPSPISNLSSLAGQGHGQWWGKWTQAAFTVSLRQYQYKNHICSRLKGKGNKQGLRT